jgi:hypothetical protein
MTTEQKTTPKKEGGALSAISTLFGKKSATQGHLSAPSPEPSIQQEEAPEKKGRELVGLGITFSEDGAAERLGIFEDEVRWMRKELLQLGEDYIREAGFVRITGRGLGKLEAELATGTTLICIATNLPNPKLVLARIPGNRLIMRVRVADSASWCKGMLLRSCIATDNPQIWICEARPRFKGRL